jgi:hypothetical protein
MSHQFRQHYTREEANALLPQVRVWLQKINGLREELTKCDQRLAGLRREEQDLGGETANRQVKLYAEVRAVLVEFQKRDIQIKDVERGLLDFPALVNGREVFLCWEADEDGVDHWHDLDTGFAGRERL